MATAICKRIRITLVEDGRRWEESVPRGLLLPPPPLDGVIPISNTAS
ncbi:hypothetical protein [Candidatus Similichlamydia laticola]|nr:hypothetical protein [Candidatus Similichlamydia laticola]